MLFKTIKDYWGDGFSIQKKTKLELPSNTITYICGCNGYGKTTLLNQLKNDIKCLDAKDISNEYYNIFKNNNSNKYYLNFNVRTSFGNSVGTYIMRGIKDHMSSNGEGLSRRLMEGLSMFKKWINDIEDKENKEFFFFLDDCDAGTSIDVIEEIKHIFKLIQDECEQNKIKYYIIVPINSYEFVCDRDSNCIDACTFKTLKFKTYNQYKKYILKTRKIKDKRCEK